MGTGLRSFKRLMQSEVPTPGRKVSMAILILLGLSCIFTFFGPVVMTLFWHMRSGFSVVYRGRTIQVPLEWIASAEPLRLELSKWKRTPFSKPPILDFADFEPLREAATTRRNDLANSWEAHYWNGGAGTGDIISGPFNIGSGADEILCMESVSKEYPNRASASCIVFQFHMKATYSGERRDLETFFQIVRKIS
jgi:hypothetical protein